MTGKETISLHRKTEKYDVKWSVSGRGARAANKALTKVFDYVDKMEDDQG
jgi:hypothetical protein